MREQPPPQLLAMLQRLGLATAAQVRRMGRRVSRLARDLPRFESVWVDALAQARILTPFQAAEISAGRGESLRIGPYVLCGSLPWPNYVNCYRARRHESGEAVRLAVVTDAGKRSDEILSRLRRLATGCEQLQSERLAPVTHAGSDGGRVWAASRWIEGRTAAEWMVHNGRFPPEVVLEVARAMLAGLVLLEKAGLCHGDISTSGLLLTDAGGVVLLQPGVRAIVRPEEGYAQADLLPEAYDYLSPERITDGTPPNTAGDVYACGCVWWHLLCGRAPLSGGNSLAKLRAAQAAAVPDVRRVAPEISGALSAAVSASLQREPQRRPESMARMAATLGLPTRSGRLALGRCLCRPRRPGARWGTSARSLRRSRRAPLWQGAIAAGLVAAAAILWPTWRAGWSSQERGLSHSAKKLPENPSNDRPASTDAVPSISENGASPRPAGRGHSGRGDDDKDYPDSFSENPVLPANYQAESSSQAPPALSQDLVLAAGGPPRGRSLQLRAGQCVRGAPGERPSVMVPRSGLVVGVENVRFENVDFVWDYAPASNDFSDVPVPQAAVIDLRAARAEFRGCSFQSTRAVSTPPAAVRWTHPARTSQSVLSLPSGRVVFGDCVLRRVGSGVCCRTIGALGVELTNTLHLGTGPLVQLDHCPKRDEPVLIALEQVTLRGAGPLLECRYRRLEDQPGEISIQAVRCAFVPANGKPLILLSGPDSPRPLLGNMQWTGQGSLVSPEAVIAAWRGSDGRQEVLDDASVSIAGLVRSQVGFAGDAHSGPGGSRIIRWQVPLRSTDPPGIDPATLPRNDGPAANR